MTTTSVIKTITIDTVGPPTDPYRAHCRECGYTTIWVRYAASVEPSARDHVRDTGHTVDIEERV